MPRLKALLAGSLALATLAVTPSLAGDTLGRTDVEAIVKEYLVAHPEVIEEAMQALEKKQAQEASAKQAALIGERGNVLFDSTRQVVLGNPDGDVTLVEFFDYNCGYCKRALGDMMALIEKDPKLRIVLKEFPVLGPGSVDAAKVAIAVNRVAPGKYLEFHKRLLATRGQVDKAKAMEVAASIGINASTLDEALAHKEVAATLEEVYGLAQGLGLSGTPSYIIGGEVVPGAIGVPKLQSRIADARCTATKKC